MSIRDLVEGEALMDDENEEGMDDYDGEVREGTGTVNNFDSSEEEDEDEDDEEAQRAVSSLKLGAWSF